MKLFVTGASGFIGSHFVKLALKAGHEIVASRRASSTVSPVQGVSWLESDLDSLRPEQLAGSDALIHLAAAGVSPKQASRAELFHWNVMVPQMLLETAKAAGVRRVVIAGSFAEYGCSAERYALIPPDAPLLPTTAYAASKAACFVASHATAIEIGLELCYLRVFSAFGEGQFISNFWPALRLAAQTGKDFSMTAGEQVRDFVPVDDVANEFLYAATHSGVSAAAPKVWNVGSGVPTTLRDFAKFWWNEWCASGNLQIGAVPYRPNEVMRYVPLITEQRRKVRTFQ